MTHAEIRALAAHLAGGICTPAAIEGKLIHWFADSSRRSSSGGALSESVAVRPDPEETVDGRAPALPAGYR